MTNSFDTLRKLNYHEQKTDILIDISERTEKDASSKNIRILRYICIIPGTLILFGFCYWIMSTVGYFVGYYSGNFPISILNQIRILSTLVMPFSALIPIIPVSISPGRKKSISWIVTTPAVLYCLFYLILNMAIPFFPEQVFSPSKPRLVESGYAIIQQAAMMLFLMQGHLGNLLWNSKEEKSEGFGTLLIGLGVITQVITSLTIFITSIYMYFLLWGVPAAGIAFCTPGLSTFVMIGILLVKNGINNLVLINWFSLFYIFWIAPLCASVFIMSRSNKMECK